jgi:ribonuclease VapC
MLFTSRLSIWKAKIAISRFWGIMMDMANDDMDAFLNGRGAEIAQIGDREAALALDAHRHFGMERHQARLNMGDCFSYACAKANSARLLYKGDDFSHTDLA